MPRARPSQTTVDPVTNKTYATTLTATTLKTSSAITGLGEGQSVVAADGTTYVIVNTGQGHGGLGIANARGQTRVVPINGQIAQAIDNAGGLALTVGFDRKAYVAYVDNDGRYHVAIVTASGGTTIKDMPVGTTTKHRVYFTIKGVAAQIVQTTDQKHRCDFHLGGRPVVRRSHRADPRRTRRRIHRLQRQRLYRHQR